MKPSFTEGLLDFFKDVEKSTILLNSCMDQLEEANAVIAYAVKCMGGSTTGNFTPMVDAYMEKWGVK